MTYTGSRVVSVVVNIYGSAPISTGQESDRFHVKGTLENLPSFIFPNVCLGLKIFLLGQL